MNMHFFFQVFISIVVVLDFLSHALVNRIFSGLSEKPKTTREVAKEHAPDEIRSSWFRGQSIFCLLSGHVSSKPATIFYLPGKLIINVETCFFMFFSVAEIFRFLWYITMSINNIWENTQKLIWVFVLKYIFIYQWSHTEKNYNIFTWFFLSLHYCCILAICLS